MKAILAFIGLLAFGEQAMAEVVGMTSNVLRRTKRILVGAGAGTAFTIDVDKRQYLVTAKHVVAGINGDKGKVKICENADCEEIEVTILRCPDPIDIAVLIPPKQMTVTYALPPEGKGMVIGQDVYFVGYPYGDLALTTLAGTESIGFVRKGVFSAQQKGENFTRMYIDGRNNEGFSGSPLVYLPQGKPGFDFKVAGVISGYRSDFTEVKKLMPIAANAITPEDRSQNLIVDMADGSHRKLTGTETYVQGNSGIVIVYPIEHAVEIIKASEVKGPDVP